MKQKTMATEQELIERMREAGRKRLESQRPIVKDPSTGKTWGSVEEYVKDPKKYGGGSRTFQQEFDKRQAEQKRIEAEKAQAEAKRQAEIKRIADEKARAEAERIKATQTQTVLRERQLQSVREITKPSERLPPPPPRRTPEQMKTDWRKVKEFTERQIEKVRDIPVVKKVREAEIVSAFKKKVGEVEKKFEPPEGVRGKADFISPEGVRDLFGMGSEVTLKGGEVGAKTTEKVLVGTGLVSPEAKLFTTPSPIKRETAKSVLTDVYMFSGFSPFMKTGAVASEVGTSQYVEVISKQTGKKIFIKKADLKRYLEEPIVKGKTYKYIGKEAGDFSTKSSRVKRLLADAKTDSAKKLVLETAQKTYGKEFIKDFVQQELGYIPKVTTTTAKEIPTSANLWGFKPPVMKNIAFLESGVSAVDRFQAFGKTQSPMQELWKQKADIKPTQKTIVKTIPGLVSRVDQKASSKTKQVQKQVQKQIAKQESKQLVKQESVIKQLSRQSSALKTEQRQKQLQRQRLMAKPRVTEIIKPKRPIYLPSLAKRVLAKVEAKPELFSVFGKRFGKDLLLLQTKDKLKAQKKLKTFLETTLGRSGEIKTKGQAIPFKDLKLFGYQYRPSVKSESRIVQKSKFSLGTSAETREIQYFKKKSKGKKSKRKSMFDWL